MSGDNTRPPGKAVVVHNHVSFDIKAVGECPACDLYGRVNWLYPSARPAASGSAVSGARERLVTGLLGFWESEGDYAASIDPVSVGIAHEYADALLPVVQALVAEGQAEALEAAAAWLGQEEADGGAPETTSDGEQLDISDPHEIAGMNWAIQSILDRTAALRATTSGEGQ